MNRLVAFPKFLTTWFATHWRLLLLLSIGLCLPLQIFAALALQTWQLDGGLSWELPLMQTIHEQATPALDQTATLLTKLGSVKRVMPVAALIALSLLGRKRWRALIYWVLTLIGCTAINWTAKGFWHRLRPHLWDGYPLPQDFSFPSGHAMTSMAFAAALMVLTWRSRWFGFTLVLGSLYVAIIGWTRLYLGVHYPSDILAGWMLSLAWAVGMRLLVRPQAVPTVALAEMNDKVLPISAQETVQ